MKRKLAVVLAATMTLNSLPITAFAAEEIPVEAVSAAENYEEEVGFADDFSAAADDFAEEAVYVEVEEPEVVDEEAGETEEELGLAEASVEYTVTSPTTIPDQTWTGEVPDLSKVTELDSIKVKDTNGKEVTLTRDKDYTVKASTSEATDDAKVLFTTMGDYAADTIAPISFKIVVKAESSSYEVTKFDTSAFVYDGAAWTADRIREEVRKASTVIKDGNSKYTDYTVTATQKTTGDNKNAGTQYEVVFKAGEKEFDKKTVTIAKLDLSKAELTAETNETLVYNGSAQKPTLKAVKWKEITLATTDYTIGEYSNNVNAGSKAEVVIKATDKSVNFTGSGKALFTIAQKDITTVDVNVEKPATVVYNGKVQTPDVSANVKAYFGKSRNDAEIPAADYEIDYVTKDSKNAGTYKIRLKATKTGNLTVDGTSEEKDAYTITEADLSTVSVTQKKDIEVGTDANANLTEYFDITLGDYKLTSDDYTSKYNENASNKDSAEKETKIELTGKGNFEKTKEISYTAKAKKMAATYQPQTDAGLVYDGTAQRVGADKFGTLVAKDDATKTLTSDQYTVTSWSNNTNATTSTSKATATIKGKGAYAGETATLEFDIAPKSIAAATPTVTGINSGSYFEGAEIKGATVVLAEGAEGSVKTTLKADDFTLTAKTVNGGYLTEVTVTGKGNYKDSIDADVKVESDVADLGDAVISGTIPAGLKTYDAAAVKKYITVKMGDTELVTYDVSDIVLPKEIKFDSEISFKITSEKLTGSKTGTVKIAKRNIADVQNITVSGTYTYNGEAQGDKKNVSVTAPADANDLTVDVDYTVDFSNNTNAGTATVIVTGKGNYEGAKTSTFEIGKYEVQNVELKTDPAESKREFKAGAPVDLSSELVLKIKEAEEKDKKVFGSSDYTVELVSGQKVEKVGYKVQYKVTIKKDSSNYTSKEAFYIVDYEIVAKSVKDAAVKIEKDTFKKGDELKVAKLGNVTVTVEGTTLNDKDYDLYIEKYISGEYKNFEGTIESVDDQYKLLVEFKGNYAGKIRKDLSVEAATNFNVDDVKLIERKASELVYDGEEKELKGSYIGELDIKEADYSKYFTIKYTDSDGKEIKPAPVEVGTYTATVKATKNYGDKTGAPLTFSIAKRVLSEDEFKGITFELSTLPYKGEKTEAPIINSIRSKKAFKNLTKDDFEVVEWDKEWDGKVESKGKAKVALIADSNYSYEGQADAEFTWEKASVGTNEKVNASELFEIEDVVYNGKPWNPVIKAIEGTDASEKWIKEADYGDFVTNATPSAMVELTIEIPEGTKYKAGTTHGSISFAIKPASIEKASVGAIADQIYTGEAIRPELAIEDENGILLVEGINYTTVYTNNTEIGTASVEITGIDNYKDSKTVTFNIVKAAEEEPTPTPTPAEDEKGETVIAVPDKKVTYTGKTIESAAAVVEGSSKKVTYNYYSDAACTKEISAPKNAGTYYVKASVAADDKYKAAESEAAKITIAKATQKLAKATTKKTLTGVSKKAKSFKINATSTSGGKITYSKVVSDSKKITVSSSGKVTVKKGLAKGTYKLVVKFKLAGTGNYKARTYNKVITVKVK